MKYIFIFMPVGLLIYVFYLYDQYWPNDYYLNEYKKITELKEHLGNRKVNGEEEPEMPDFYNNNTTLYGIDKNKNGIRDDVEIWINFNARSKLEREMYVNYASSFFYYTENDILSTDEVDLLREFRIKYLKRNRFSVCLNMVCEFVNKKTKFKISCADRVFQFEILVLNNKYRDTNLSDANKNFDFSFKGDDIDICLKEYKSKVEKDELF